MENSVQEVQEQLNDILSVYTGRIVPDVSEEGEVIADINTSVLLTDDKLRKLLELGLVAIKRSGAGIKISIRIKASK